MGKSKKKGRKPTNQTITEKSQQQSPPHPQQLLISTNYQTNQMHQTNLNADPILPSIPNLNSASTLIPSSSLTDSISLATFTNLQHEATATAAAATTSEARLLQEKHENNHTKSSSDRSSSPSPSRSSPSSPYSFLFPFLSPAPPRLISDNQISKTFIWRFTSFIVSLFLSFFHAHRVFGGDNVDCNMGAFFISYHSTHNADILPSVIAIHNQYGKIPRCLVHRVVMFFFPFLRLFGAESGYRDTAVRLLRSNFWVAAIPGGGEEAMTGGENSYNLTWPIQRVGFVHAAREAGVYIYPFFTANVEEMRFNPFFFIANKLHISRAYTRLLLFIQKLFPSLASLLFLFGEWVWFSLSILAIPLPALLTSYCGNSIRSDDPNETVEEVVRKSKSALEDLINMYQFDGSQERKKQGLNYYKAIKDRFSLALFGDWRDEEFSRKSTILKTKQEEEEKIKIKSLKRKVR